MKCLYKNPIKCTCTTLKTATILMTIFLLIPNQAFASFITNGSFTGPLANAQVPTGWSINSLSPDTNNLDANAGGEAQFYINPNDFSPDGGTWVGLLGGLGYSESFGQTVTGLTIGTQYELSWYQSNFGGIASNGAVIDGTNAIEVLVDNVSAGVGDLLVPDPYWYNESLLFVATAASHRIDFRTDITLSDNAYLSLDGVSLDIATVPVPAGIWLFGSGFIVLTGIARRRNT